jgi:hypothetical protein
VCVSHRAPAGSSHSPALHCQSPSSGQRRRGGGDRDGRCGETPLRARLHSGASLPVCLEGTGGPRCAAHVTDVWARVREAQGEATAWEPLTKGFFCSQQPCKRAHLDVKEDHSARTACGDLRLDDGVSLYASRVRLRVAFLCRPSLTALRQSSVLSSNAGKALPAVSCSFPCARAARQNFSCLGEKNKTERWGGGPRPLLRRSANFR